MKQCYNNIFAKSTRVCQFSGHGYGPLAPRSRFILHWHRPTDLFVTFSDADFRLGFNAAQTTLAAVAQLVEARRVEARVLGN